MAYSRLSGNAYYSSTWQQNWNLISRTPFGLILVKIAIVIWRVKKTVITKLRQHWQRCHFTLYTQHQTTGMAKGQSCINHITAFKHEFNATSEKGRAAHKGKTCFLHL